MLLRSAAGYGQERSGNSKRAFIGSFFGDPDDQRQILRGVSDAENGCY